MKNFFKYLSAILAGVILGMILIFERAKKSINSTNIKKQVQRNWRSAGNKQENTTVIDKKKRRFKLFNKKRK